MPDRSEEKKHGADSEGSSSGEPEKKPKIDGPQGLMVTPGLAAHLAYCKANGISKERAVEHFSKAFDLFSRPLGAGESWYNRMEELLGAFEFEKDAEVGLWEYVFSLFSRCDDEL